MEIEERKASWIVELEKSLTSNRPSIMKDFLGHGIDVVLVDKKPTEVVFRKSNFPSAKKLTSWLDVHDIEGEVLVKINSMRNQRTSYMFQNIA